MDPVTALTHTLKPLWWLIPLGLTLALLKSPQVKGYLGELRLRLSARLFLDPDTYRPIHNATLPTADGTTQIDHIFVSRYGIFVVETKNMSGWIFGSEKQPTWTQKRYRRTYKFQNPLRQNDKHTKALEAALGIPADTIHSVVVFVGGSTFKTPMPTNVTHARGYLRYIKSFEQPVFTQDDVDAIINRIDQAKLAPTLATHQIHVQGLKARSNPTAERNCPKCGNAMLLRTIKRAEREGMQFWGCSYPNCRMVQDVV